MLNKLNSNDLQSVTGGIGKNGLLPDNAHPLGQASWGVLIDSTKGILCAYKGKNVSEGDLIVTLNGNAVDQFVAIRNADSPGGFPPPTGTDAEGCATYY